jgi:hypothetical protein
MVARLFEENPIYDRLNRFPDPIISDAARSLCAREKKPPMYFAILCFDEPGAGELREITRPARLAYLKQHGDKIHLGGPFENNMGGIVGTGPVCRH